METNPPDVYTRRRVRLFTYFTIFCLILGFVWGLYVGYEWGFEKGRRYMMEDIEQRLNEGPKAPTM